jgi:hypothetical protein
MNRHFDLAVKCVEAMFDPELYSLGRAFSVLTGVRPAVKGAVTTKKV